MKRIKRLSLCLIIAFILIYIIYSVFAGGFKFGSSYAFIFDKNKPDSFLSHKYYKYSYYVTDTTVYFIIMNNHFAKISSYKVNNKGQINISLKQDDKLIISFPNRGTPCRYFIYNLKDINIINYKNDTIIHTANISADGSIFERQNMYIDIIKPGKDQLIIKQEDSQGYTAGFTDFDQIYININVEK